LNFSTTFHRTTFQSPTLCSGSIVITSEVCMSAMLILILVLQVLKRLGLK